MEKTDPLKEAKATAPVACTLQRGERFTALTGDVHILQAGKVVFSRKVRVSLEGTNFLFTPVDTLYPLLYEGEGLGRWYFRGKEGGGFFFFGNASDPSDDAQNTFGRGWEVVRPIIDQW